MTVVKPKPEAPWVPPRPSTASRRPSSRSKTSARPSLVTPLRAEMHPEGLLEYDAALWLLSRPDVADVVEQPPAVSYVDDYGVPRRHTFDSLATLRDGTRMAVVVKPWKLSEERGTRRLLELLAAQTPAWVAQRFLLLTDRDLDRVTVSVARLVHAARRCRDPGIDAALRRGVGALAGPTRVGDLVRSCELGADGLMAVARLVGDGGLALRRGVRLDHGAVVTPVPNREPAP